MARRYMFWCLSAALRNRASLWSFWSQTQIWMTLFLLTWMSAKHTTPESSESRTATNRHSDSGSWWSSFSTSPVTVYRFRWTENSLVCAQETNSVTHKTHISHHFTHFHAKVFSVVQCCWAQQSTTNASTFNQTASNLPCQGWPYVGTWTGFQLPKTSFKH